jgi:hypothetical protein
LGLPILSADTITDTGLMRYVVKGDTYPLRHCFPPFRLTWDEDEEVWWTEDEEEWCEAVQALGKEPPDGATELTITADLTNRRVYPVGYCRPDREPTHFMCRCSRREVIRVDSRYTHACMWYSLERDPTDRELTIREIP